MDSNFVVYSCHVKFEVTDKSKKHFSWSMTLIDLRNDVKMLKTHAQPAGYCKVLSSPRERALTHLPRFVMVGCGLTVTIGIKVIATRKGENNVL